MRKRDELSRPRTCMNSAHPEEMTFVLLGRDAAAPIAIRAWVAERLRLGKNQPDDVQITEALECAATMEAEGRKWVGAATHYPTLAERRAALGFPERSAEERRALLASTLDDVIKS